MPLPWRAIATIFARIPFSTSRRVARATQANVLVMLSKARGNEAFTQLSGIIIGPHDAPARARAYSS